MASAPAAPSTTQSPAALPGVKASTSSQPFNWLTPLSPDQVQQQATKTIAAAYKPGFDDLNTQQSRTQAVSDKRTADNKYYETWLDGKMNELQAHLDQQHQLLAQAAGAPVGNAQAQFAGQADSLVAEANNRAGNVSNNATSNAFGTAAGAGFGGKTLLGADQGAVLGTLGAQRTFELGSADNQNNAFAATRLNAGNIISLSQQKQLSDLNAALTKLGDARTKLGTAEKGDIAKEIGRLQGVEIQKANAQRNYDAAVAKLGVTAQYDAGKLQQGQQQVGVAKQNANTAASRASETARHNAALEAQAKANEADRLAAQQWKQAHSGSAKPLTIGQANTLYTRIGDLQGQLNELISYGYSRSQAYHFIQNGGTVPIPGGRTTVSNHTGGKTNTKTTTQTTTKTYQPAGNIQLLNIAFNTATGGSGLSPGDIAALRTLTLDPSRYPVDHNFGHNSAAQGVANQIGQTPNLTSGW